MNRMSPTILAEVAILAAMITILGAIKIPSLLPGLEFQLSAPLAVAICAAFGFKKYIIAGILSSSIGLILGTHNLLNVAIAMQFRLIVGLVLALGGRRLLFIMISGPIASFIARITLSMFIGKAALALVLAALPGMIFTMIGAPFMTKLLMKIQILRGVPSIQSREH
jgi:hypothetical protein